MQKQTKITVKTSYPLDTTLWAAKRREPGEMWELAPQPYHLCEIRVYVDPNDRNQVKTEECWFNTREAMQCYATRKSITDTDTLKFFETEVEALEFITSANGTSEVLRHEMERMDELREKTCRDFEHAARDFETAKAEMERVRVRALKLKAVYDKAVAGSLNASK